LNNFPFTPKKAHFALVREGGFGGGVYMGDRKGRPYVCIWLGDMANLGRNHTPLHWRRFIGKYEKKNARFCQLLFTK